ncbi:MAG TPA: hypothetical protein VFI86_07415 [Burkholderiales bacterium]|nr:hypothetical protein [Burkholderiales bacterium]
MTARWSALAAIGAVVLAACAGRVLVAGMERDAPRVVVAPYQSHELCARLAANERLDYRFTSSAPVAFSIAYREGSVVLMPVVQDHATSGSGIYEAPFPQRYCLGWEAGPPGAILSYRVIVRPRPR